MVNILSDEAFILQAPEVFDSQGNAIENDGYTIPAE